MQLLPRAPLPQQAFQLLQPERFTVAYDKFGSGPPLVLVHSCFSTPQPNWELVKSLFQQQFTVYTVSCGEQEETEVGEDHDSGNKSLEVVTLIRLIGEPLFLLGHAAGAEIALAAAAKIPELVSKLVLYATPWPRIVGKAFLAGLEVLTQTKGWHDFTMTFFHDNLLVSIADPISESNVEVWPPIIASARVSLNDLQVVSRQDFNEQQLHELRVPVLLQLGGESTNTTVTQDFGKAIPELQLPTDITTAPRIYAEAVSRFLLR